MKIATVQFYEKELLALADAIGLDSAFDGEEGELLYENNLDLYEAYAALQLAVKGLK